MNKTEKWHVSYHGTQKQAIEPIFGASLHLLKPGDTMLGGVKIGIRDGHIPNIFPRTNQHTGKLELFDPKQVFTVKISFL